MGFILNEIFKYFINFGFLSIVDVRYLNEIKKLKIVYCD